MSVASQLGAWMPSKKACRAAASGSCCAPTGLAHRNVPATRNVRNEARYGMNVAPASRGVGLRREACRPCVTAARVVRSALSGCTPAPDRETNTPEGCHEWSCGPR
jgi:hypothetical protein